MFRLWVQYRIPFWKARKNNSTCRPCYYKSRVAHHFYIDGKLKPKDMERQNNIINHFESIQKPLTEFIRVKSNENRSVLKIETVYKGKS